MPDLERDPGALDRAQRVREHLALVLDGRVLGLVGEREVAPQPDDLDGTLRAQPQDLGQDRGEVGRGQPVAAQARCRP